MRRTPTLSLIALALVGPSMGPMPKLFAAPQTAPASAVQGQALPTQIVVHAKKYSFSPDSITLKKGQTVKLVLISDDDHHGLAVKGLDIHADMPKHKPTEITITPTTTGDFPGTCSVYCGRGHRDMEFVVHVVD